MISFFLGPCAWKKFDFCLKGHTLVAAAWLLLFACLPACLLACLPAACLPAACLLACCLLACLLACCLLLAACLLLFCCLPAAAWVDRIANFLRAVHGLDAHRANHRFCCGKQGAHISLCKFPQTGVPLNHPCL